MKFKALTLSVWALLLPTFASWAQEEGEAEAADPNAEVVPLDEEQLKVAAAEGAGAATALVKEAVDAAAAEKIEAAEAKANAKAEAAIADAKAKEQAKVVANEKADKLKPENEKGNLYTTRNSIYPVFQRSDASRTKAFCLPHNTKFRVGEKQDDGMIAITIETFPGTDKTGEGVYKKSVRDTTPDRLERKCNPIVDGNAKPTDWAVSDFAHVIDADALLAADLNRTGFTFGVLAVPFKYYLGDEKKLAVSSTVATYFGMSFEGKSAIRYVPFVAAGVGFVPVESDGADDGTKVALSTGAGLLITSSKNPDWSTGLMVGKDFLGKADRAGDPTVGDGWVSLFVGMQIK